MNEGIKLYSYWRSSAAYRVRIALNLKRLPYSIIPVHLLNNGGEQHRAEFHALNPQERVPVLVDGHRVLRQSMAIIEYLEESYEGTTRLLPSTARERARVRGLAQILVCDTHPLNNLRVMRYLEEQCGMPQAEREQWIRHWIHEGFSAIEALLEENDSTGNCCEGDEPSLADACLIPQVYSAHRWSLDMTPFPMINNIYEHCMKLPAFDRARPENQPDAPAV